MTLLRKNASFAWKALSPSPEMSLQTLLLVSALNTVIRQFWTSFSLLAAGPSLSNPNSCGIGILHPHQGS